MTRGTEQLRQSRRFSVAPMMDWTDRHCRHLHRLLTKRALLFTEMVTSAAVTHGPRERLLAFSPAELQFLFPAPVTRRQLVQFKLVRAQLVILVNILTDLLYGLLDPRISAR